MLDSSEPRNQLPTPSGCLEAIYQVIIVICYFLVRTSAEPFGSTHMICHTVQNDQISISKVSLDDDSQSFEIQRKNNHIVISLCAQAFVGTTPTQKSLMRNLHAPVKKILH